MCWGYSSQQLSLWRLYPGEGRHDKHIGHTSLCGYKLPAQVVNGGFIRQIQNLFGPHFGSQGYRNSMDFMPIQPFLC